MGALNCKPGDLAIVVNTELPENLGQIVEVVSVQTGYPCTLIGKGHVWYVRTASGRATLTYRHNHVPNPTFAQHADGPAPDRCLRPISGLDDDGGEQAATRAIQVFMFTAENAALT